MGKKYALENEIVITNFNPCFAGKYNKIIDFGKSNNFPINLELIACY